MYSAHIFIFFQLSVSNIVLATCRDQNALSNHKLDIIKLFVEYGAKFVTHHLIGQNRFQAVGVSYKFRGA